mmetsp:Transcript_5284/g.7623  ORF Transcript_5284/g.7623 Transcript_5284/m.7623 type:complete len:418 (+) Transcript_5284:180-1433(+)|eukprot:CAMPEP_0194208748 /NCGR_PEP_ID=MMETSP0156-20130528/7110_1 /TAXON_ID=33649 /ORGANISM="Thalassionema nitzschioides, Strain L26-B" /LENGTH=417 /DNA_ID=CAMNT_0038935779 /DNA_START=166 /DNA_END=1419 /DNA_ORIENTATION=-
MSAQAKNYIREDANQAIVDTPYGRGLVLRSGREDGVREIQLTEWEIAPSRSTYRFRGATLYSCSDYPSVKVLKGDDVICLWGRGKVSEIQPNGIVAIKLNSWRLAKRSLVNCYLKASDVQVVRKKTQSEMTAYERVEFSKEYKASANEQFCQKLYEAALIKYSKAVDAIRYVQHDNFSSNEIRADLVMVMVTSCNNAATCCRQLQKWDECIKFAKNALVLLDALSQKRGLRIHAILNSDGFKDSKLFGEWRVKSYLLIGRVHFAKKEYEEALASFETANNIISQEVIKTPILDSQQKEVKNLMAHCTREKRIIKRKEKKRAQAMFGGDNKTTQNNTPTEPELVTKIAPLKDTVSDDRVKHREQMGALMPNREVAVYNKVQDEEEELPWYDEHKEALIVATAIVAATVLGVTLLRSKR